MALIIGCAGSKILIVALAFCETSIPFSQLQPVLVCSTPKALGDEQGPCKHGQVRVGEFAHSGVKGGEISKLLAVQRDMDRMVAHGQGGALQGGGGHQSHAILRQIGRQNQITAVVVSTLDPDCWLKTVL